MKIWAEIYSTAGALLAELHDIIDASATLRIDEAGDWSMTVGHNHPALAHLAVRNTVKIKAYFGTTETLLGGGYIHRRTYATDSTTIRISGIGLLRRLAVQQILNYTLYEMTSVSAVVSAAPGTAATDSGYENVLWDGAEYTSTSVNFTNPDDDWDLDTNAGNPDYLYLGYWTPFDRATFTITTGNSATANLTLQYLKFSTETGLMTWTDLTIDTNTTIDTGRPFYASGYIAWTIPSDWGLITHASRERYWVRIKSDADLSNVTCSALTLRVRGPHTTDISTLYTAYKPTGWTLDTGTWYSGTTSGTYWERLHGISLLAALREIALRTGEHFRLSTTTDNQLQWLQDDTITSAAICTTFGDPQDLAAQANRYIITSLTVEEDATQYINRLYVEGAGEGSAALTLSRATDTYTGYTISTSSSYVEITGTTTVEAGFKKFSDITSQSGRATATACNELLAAAVNELARRSQTDYTAYRLTVAGISTGLTVGTWVRVIWRGASDNGLYVDIDESLYLHSVTYNVTPDGLTATLGVANYDRPPTTYLDFITTQIADTARASRAVQPADFTQKAINYIWLDNRNDTSSV